jgi:DHA2 family methylenomycin A resistance protein-like MFS transporter
VGAGVFNSGRQTGAVLGVATLGTVLGRATSVTDGAPVALGVAGAVLLVGAFVVGRLPGRVE